MKQVLNWMSWKKLFIIISLLLLLFVFFYFVNMYMAIEKSRVVNGDQTEQFIFKETDITEILEMYEFQGEETFHIMFGSDDKGEKSLVFVPLSESLTKNDIVVVSEKNILTKEDLEKSWEKDCDGCQLLLSGPAMIDEKPLWELTYIDRSNRYVIEYVSLKDGSIYEQLKLYRKYSEKG